MSVAFANEQDVEQETASDRLRTTMTAARVSFTWLGVRRSLNTQQKDQAAQSFNAEGKFLSAGKKLMDTRHPAFRAVTAVRNAAIAYWKENSLPYPEPGIRLIRLDAVEEFSRRMARFRVELNQAVRQLSDHYYELREAARERLGELYNASDYPPTLEGEFGIEFEFPNVEPPEYLRELSPNVYRQECQRMQSRFEEAVTLAEQAFVEELSNLVDHLTERLSGTEDGKPKVFRDSAVTNLTEFFNRFRRLNIRSNPELDQLVAEAREAVRSARPDTLRRNEGMRQIVTEQLASVRTGIDQLMVDRPRRNIQRRPS